ncbi:Tyrosyl-tRNA synthetase [Yersinia phage fHe-Yen9-03]|uniref:tyrosine--tRNA ligase n=1 Tax=Yersinia phage fHe-Yen9-03 TaxID=2052743 RepID=A0A2C9CYK4_9CAUD|nr:Tyrosyl-tRNA synthetase [Yersinia phage fHe-Yen9-03]
MHPVLVELQNRGLINQSTDISVLSSLLDNGSSVYCGFDPTADSLHIGSLLPLMTMKVLKEYGVNVIALVGGATGRIGDPSFKAQERKLLDEVMVEHNIAGITTLIRSFLGSDTVIVNNFDWTKDLSVLDFLRIYGKCFSVNTMISKESVRSRIERPDQGISFTEFTYPILQGMDFEHLYNGGCAIQIGGSDQWGNMIAGTDLIHKMHGNDKQCGVITLPLLLKSDGTKFGKSETGTVWLSPDKTSAYHMYQFWVNISDDEMYTMYQYFKPMSFSIDSIRASMVDYAPLMKKQFAHAMTAMIHGVDKADQAHNISQFIFGEKVVLDNDTIVMMQQSGMGHRSIITDSNNLVSTLVELGLAKSKKMAREFITNGAAKVNGRKINEFFNPATNEFIEDVDMFDMKYYVIQCGKTNFFVVENRRI